MSDDVMQAYGRLLSAGWRRYGLNPIGATALFLSPTSEEILPLWDAVAALEKAEHEKAEHDDKEAA